MSASETLIVLDAWLSAVQACSGIDSYQARSLKIKEQTPEQERPTSTCIILLR